MTLRVLLALHAAVTLAAAIVLMVFPSAIPATVGLHIGRDAYMTCYLLAASELGLSVLSWGARNVTDVTALRLILTAIVTVHATSGLLEIYLTVGGPGTTAAIWGNVAFRGIVVALFTHYKRSLSA